MRNSGSPGCHVLFGRTSWGGIAFPAIKPSKLFTCDFGNRVEITHLRFDVLFSATKPEALTCATVNAQRSSDGISVPARLQEILLGKDLDAFPLLAVFDRNAEPHGQIADINPEVIGWQWFSSEDPEVPTTTAVLEALTPLHSA